MSLGKKANPIEVLIVEKGGDIKSVALKEVKEEELYKKCGFKKAGDFKKHAQWPIKNDGVTYVIELYGKTDGRPGTENKYDFPPPADGVLFFGSCLLAASCPHEKTHVSLKESLWQKVYEKLFGGFEDLTKTAKEDEEEVDDLAHVPKKNKTKQGGYLKDGFVVDSGSSVENSMIEEDSASSMGEDSSLGDTDPEEDETELILQDVGSELSEDSYDYDESN